MAEIDTDVVRPEVVTQEHLVYLDELRESGKTNMFGARPYLLLKFPELSESEAASVLVYWMQTFGRRHTYAEKAQRDRVKADVRRTAQGG